MKRIFGFSNKSHSQSRSSVIPRRDSGIDGAVAAKGYRLQDKELGKLHKAASIGDIAKVQRLLRKNDPNEPDKLNRTPLHIACASGYPDVVSLLVERNCKLNLCDGDNRTPLIKAVQCQQEECATILLSHGADPNVVDTRSNTALHYSALGHNRAIAAKLVEHKGDIEAKNQEGYTPLLLAITEHNKEMVDFFLKNGANVNACDNSKRTALMIAVSTEPTSIVNLLLQFDIDLSLQDNYGWTAEEYALVSGFPVHRELILQYGQRQLNQLTSAKISSPDRASDTVFTLGGPALDKEEIQESPVQTSRTRISGKVVEESSPEDSISRFSDKPGPDDSWPTSDEEELDFSTQKLPKPNLKKLINASQQIRTNGANDEKISRNASPQQSYQKKTHGTLNIEDHKALMSPDNSYVNYQEEDGIGSSQDEGQLADYEDEVAEEEKSEEEEEKFSQDGQDDIDGEEELEYVDTEDEEESQAEDFENMKEKESLNNQQNLSLHTTKYDRNEAKCKISKEKQRTNIPTEFPGSVIADIYEDLSENFYGTFLKEELIDTEEEEKKDGALFDNENREQIHHETSNILSELQAPITSQKCTVRRDMLSALGLEDEEDTESPWDSECTSESLPKESVIHVSAAPNQAMKESISRGSLEDYPKKHPNLQPTQPTLVMKDSFTNQETEKGVMEKEKSDLLEEFGLDDADDIDDVSNWDSPSTSQKNVTYRNYKDLNFDGNYPCKSMPLTKNQSGSTEFGELPLKEDETAAAVQETGPEPRFSVVILVDKPGSQKQSEPQLLLEKEESKKDLTQESEFEGSSEESQENFDKSDQEEEEIILETANTAEQTASKKQLKPLSFPVLHLKTALLEESNSEDMHLDADQNWEEKYEKMWVEKDKMEVKKNFKIITTELKQVFGEISTKNKIAHQSTEELQEDESKPLQEVSSNFTNNSSDNMGIEKSGDSLDIGFQSFPEEREDNPENDIFQHLNLTFEEKVHQSPFNLCSKSSHQLCQNENNSETVYTCNVNEEDVTCDAEIVRIASSKKITNEMKEDGAFDMQMAVSLDRNTINLRPNSEHLLESSGLGSHFGDQLTGSHDVKPIIQDKEPTITTTTKFNEKTELNENLFQNLVDSDNSTNELRHWKYSLPSSDKISKMYLDKELKQDVQRFKNELGMLKVEFLALEKEKTQLQKEVEEEKKKHLHNEMETLEERSDEKLNINKMIGKDNLANKVSDMKDIQHGKDEENKIPGEEIPKMNISNSKESSTPMHHLLECNDSAMNLKYVKKPPSDKWISEDPGITSSCEKVNSLTSILLQVHDDSSLSEDLHEGRPGNETLNKTNKDKGLMDADDLDDLTQSSDTATLDDDLPPSSYKTIILLIEQLSIDCKDSISLLKIQDAVLTYERSLELKKGRCTLLAEKVKSLENKITGLQEELSETREVKSQLEHQKVEWDRELCSLRFTLKQEEEKRLNSEMLFKKISEQLRRKEKQYIKEVEIKEQLELTLRSLHLELKAVRNNLKQVEEERNETQRKLSHEQSARALQDGILSNHFWKQKEAFEANVSKMNQSCEVPDSHEKDLQKNHTLQDEIAMLKLELDAVKIKNQEKENRYTEENEVLKEKNDELQKELKLNEEALTKTVLQYSGQLNVLTTENAMLNSKLKNEKQNRDRVEIEIESYRSRLTSAILDHERSQTSKLDLEHTFQRERDEWLRLQDKLNYDLSSLKDNNGVLSQQLSKAESKANSLENELHLVRDSLREKTLILESTQRDLNQAQYQAKELEHTNQIEKEKLNKYVVKQESMQERFAQIQSENMLLRQQLEDAQNKGIIKEKVVSDVQVQFSDLFNKLRADSEKQVLMVEERNKELINECNHLKEQMCKYENEKAEREVTVRQLQQELADSLKKQSMSEASLEVTSRYRNDLEDKKQQLQKEIDQIKSKLQESEERHLQSKRSTNELEDHIQKLEIENARLEATVKQQMNKIEQIQQNMLDATSLDNEREKLKKLIELKQSLESRLDQEIKRNGELQKDISGFKRLLKATKKKLKDYEKGNLDYQGRMKHACSEEDGQINRLKNKIDELTQQLEDASSKCIHLESMNRGLQEELFSLKTVQKKCDRLEKNKKQLEEEIANLKHHLEIYTLERSQVEQYKREIEERARQEIVEKLKEVNLFLQTQAASQENLEQLRENNNASIRNQMEHRIRDLESELSKLKNSQQDSTKAELEIYRQLYSEELKTRKSLSNKLERTNERLAEVSAELLNEKQRSKTLITSFTASPVLEPPHIGNLNNSLVLNRGLIPRGNIVYSTGNTVSSRNRAEAYFTKMQQELEKNIARELNEATGELESGSCWPSPIGSTDESSRMSNVNQDPVSRATQEYIEVLKKNYML
ncbi:ankyrin repeat domain-containing protein 26 isoform X2 [Monodelphis domestica]|uniref:ankyrin repeat domain-containing protein 26 isoform X2 n=1 Tax=Monodelphis domestica TaxID=13616 RepID=UPI0024E27572|nr:ankyrin repeat domain-containing protein 26 isoform X2 [Monodelphis domestica]